MGAGPSFHRTSLCWGVGSDDTGAQHGGPGQVDLVRVQGQQLQDIGT